MHYDVTDKKTITSVLKVSTCIITSIAAHPMTSTIVLVIISVLTFKTVVILYTVKPVIYLEERKSGLVKQVQS